MESPRVLLADDLPEMLETVTQLLRNEYVVPGITLKFARGLLVVLTVRNSPTSS